MDVGSQHAEERFGEPCFLSSCLAVCLLDLEESRPRSASLLRLALQRLRRSTDEMARFRMYDVPRAGAVGPFLTFLLPEIEAKSPQAARAVRGALRHLQNATPLRRPVLRPLLN